MFLALLIIVGMDCATERCAIFLPFGNRVNLLIDCIYECN